MTRPTIRKGDTVLIRATVTDVADYDKDLGQQIQVRCEPKGAKSFGWMVPTEYDFRLDKQLIKVGDRVWLDKSMAGSLVGEVVGILPADGLNPAYAWIKPAGRSDFRTMRVDGLERA